MDDRGKESAADATTPDGLFPGTAAMHWLQNATNFFQVYDLWTKKQMITVLSTGEVNNRIDGKYEAEPNTITMETAAETSSYPQSSAKLTPGRSMLQFCYMTLPVCYKDIYTIQHILWMVWNGSFCRKWFFLSGMSVQKSSEQGPKSESPAPDLSLPGIDISSCICIV